MSSFKNRTYLIAEIGINHEGDYNLCKKMVKEASICGVDAIKLQTINPDKNYTQQTKSYEIFKGSELTKKETADIFRYAKSLNLDFFTTAGDTETIDWIDELSPTHWKISSGLLTHLPVVSHIAKKNRPIILSTGMAYPHEIKSALECIKLSGNENISILQCSSIYPCPKDEINLAAIPWLKKEYGYKVGFSDHSIGINAAVLAVAIGAEIIEKHFTFDKNRPGFDHGISVDASELKIMVDEIREAEILIGSSEKIISKRIQESRDHFLRYIVASRQIDKGDIFTVSNIDIKRTSVNKPGLEPSKYNKILGMKATKKFEVDDLINI